MIMTRDEIRTLSRDFSYVANRHNLAVYKIMSAQLDDEQSRMLAELPDMPNFEYLRTGIQVISYAKESGFVFDSKKDFETCAALIEETMTRYWKMTFIRYELRFHAVGNPDKDVRFAGAFRSPKDLFSRIDVNEASVGNVKVIKCEEGEERCVLNTELRSFAALNNIPIKKVKRT